MIMTHENWNEPLDRQMIETLRAWSDKHQDDPYGLSSVRVNWLYLSRMVAAMEKGL